MSETKKDAVAMDNEAEVLPDQTEYIEFVGQEPHGTEFYGRLGTHSISAKHMKEFHDTELGKKDIVWTRGSNGRFLVPVTDMTPEAAEILARDPMFKRVSI